MPAIRDTIVRRLLPLSLLLLLFSGQALAEACTYRDAIMALQQGNQVRGMALLRMASRDGDLRASLYLASLEAGADKPASAPLPVLAKSTR